MTSKIIVTTYTINNLGGILFGPQCHIKIMYLNYLISSVGIFFVVGDSAYNGKRSYHPCISGGWQ